MRLRSTIAFADHADDAGLGQLATLCRDNIEAFMERDEADFLRVAQELILDPDGWQRLLGLARVQAGPEAAVQLERMRMSSADYPVFIYAFLRSIADVTGANASDPKPGYDVGNLGQGELECEQRERGPLVREIWNRADFANIRIIPPRYDWNGQDPIRRLVRAIFGLRN